MKNKYFKSVLFAGMITCFILLALPRPVVAAGTTMEFSPQAGSFDKQFNVSLVIDGHGERFNAAQTNAIVSSNLTIKDLALGDCDFSFFRTPSIVDPSFKGIILGKYSRKCTVYTVVLGPVAKGKASISLSKSSIKRYGDAAEILSGTKNAAYTLTGISDKVSVLGAQTKKPPKDGLYSVDIKILSKENVPVVNAVVILSSISKKDEQKTISDDDGVAHFSKLKTGVYTVTVERNGDKLGENIINVSGPNHTLNFSINVESQKGLLLNNLLLIIGAVLVIGIILGLFLSRFKRPRFG